MLSVLVVDDRPEVAQTIAAMCRSAGFAASVATGGGVRAEIERDPPSCMIVDIMMPDEDGYEALKEIARVDRAMPVLLISGHGEAWLEMGVTLGRAHGLKLVERANKPVRMDVLQKFLDRARAARGDTGETAPT